MIALTGDVIVQTIGLVVVALLSATIPSWLAARRSGRAEKELKPNGGASLRDAVDRLDARTTEHDRRFGRIESSLDGVATTLDRIEKRQTGE